MFLLKNWLRSLPACCATSKYAYDQLLLLTYLSASAAHYTPSKYLPVGVYANLNTRLSESRNDSFLYRKWKAVIRFHYILQSFRLIVIFTQTISKFPLD